MHPLDEELVFLRWTRSTEELPSRILGKHIHRVIDLHGEVIGDSIKFSLLRRDNSAIFRLKLEATRAGPREMALNNDRLSVVTRHVGAISTVFDPHNNCSILFPLLDETFQTTSTLSSGSFSSQTESDRCQYSTLTTAVFTNDKVDKWPQLYGEMIMTHKVIAFDTFQDSLFGWFIGFIDDMGVFLLNDLGLANL